MIVSSALKQLPPHPPPPPSQGVPDMLMSTLISRYGPSAMLILCGNVWGIFSFTFQLAVFAPDVKVTRSKADINDNKGIKLKA